MLTMADPMDFKSAKASKYPYTFRETISTVAAII